MNYYEALQRKTDGRWDYTRNGSHPVGYCAGTFDEQWPETPRESHLLAWGTAEHYAADRSRHVECASKYHADGHASKEDAQRCYREYELDHRLRLDGGETSHTYRRCQAPEKCMTLTNRYAMLGSYRMFHLCDEHRNRSTVAALVDAKSGLVMSSE